MKFKLPAFCMMLLLFLREPTTKAQALIDFETGLIYTGYNDVRIPGTNGTLFSLKKRFKIQDRTFL